MDNNMLPSTISQGGEHALSIASTDDDLLKAIKKFEDAVKKKHKQESNKSTPKAHVKKKAGLDYVEFAYMRNRANEAHPLWSFTKLQISTDFLKAGWVVVQGQLEWYENGFKRIGACAAAHRIAFKSGQDRVPENIIDLGNDVKAAVSDCMKKGFNTYMNISDDVYKKQTVEEITDEQKEYAYSLIENVSDTDTQHTMYRYIDNKTYKNNLPTIIKKIKAVLDKQEFDYSEIDKKYEDILNLSD